MIIASNGGYGVLKMVCEPQIMVYYTDPTIIDSDCRKLRNIGISFILRPAFIDRLVRHSCIPHMLPIMRLLTVKLLLLPL